ncbi:Transcriptional regulator MraZ [uncultured Gammaproteobacteria bacterium]
MAVFLSTYVNKIDKKGRISVPAEFRKVLAAQTYQGVVVFRSLHHPALEACSAEHLEQLSENMDRLDLSPEEYEVIETTVFGGSVPLPFDGEGRIVLPQHLVEFAGLGEEAAFVGRRKTFQIWNPPMLRAHETEAREKARARDISLSKIIAKATMIGGSP